MENAILTLDVSKMRMMGESRKPVASRYKARPAEGERLRGSGAWRLKLAEMIAVVVKRGRAWDSGRPLAEQHGFAEHVALVTGLLDRGVAIEAGPFADPSLLRDDDLVALALLDVESVSAGERLFANDPFVVGDVVSLHLYEWGGAPLRRGSD
jgi:hypothetical protein